MSTMKELFPEFYRKDYVEKEDFKESAIVIDTNFLLSILKLPTVTSEKYIEALKKVKDNIYIPYLVALEFNFNKGKIKKIKRNDINKYIGKIKTAFSDTENAINNLDLLKIDDENFTNDLLEKKKRVRASFVG